MTDDEKIKSVVNQLGENKQKFLNDVQAAIKIHIAKKSPSECLSINQLWLSGNIKSTWSPEVSKAYFERLMAFLRKKKFKENNLEYTLDSKLTPQVVDLVTEKFNKFYSSNADIFTKPLTKQLMEDQVFVNKLAETLIDSTKGSLPENLKKQLISHLVHMMQESMGVNIAHTVGTAMSAAFGKAVSAVVAMNISSSVIAAVLHQVAIALQGAIAKVLASAAFKSTVVAFIKKIAAIKIVAFLVALIASVPVLGPAIATAPLWIIVAPALAGFIYYQISSLPERMSERVSIAVVEELSGEFEKLNTSVVTQIFATFSKDTLGTLIKDIADEVSQNATFRETLDSLNKK